MFTIDELLAGMQISRSAFAAIFLRVQDVPLEERIYFEAIGASSSDDSAAFRVALTYAAARGWFEAIETELCESSFVSDALLAKRINLTASPPLRTNLQAMIDQATGFIDPDLLRRGLLRAIRATARILVNGRFQGSGVLVGPQLVLTAWHVVKPLFQLEPLATPSWRLSHPAAGRVAVEFDNVVQRNRNGAMTAPAPQIIQTHAEWLVAFSSCHVDELTDRLPGQPQELNGCWDYAVIKLADALDRGEFPLDLRAQVPRAKQQLIVLQYPAGQPQRVSIGEIAVAQPAFGQGVSDYRFFHKGNALPGSSGGPCFDKYFALFGIHQGSISDANGVVLNRGVPIAKIIPHFQQVISDNRDIDLDLRKIAILGAAFGGTPVIGGDDFQRMVWRSAIGGKKKLFTISGAHPGCGKTFCIDVLRSILPDERHLKILLPASSIAALDASSLAKMICSAAGGALDPLSPPNEPNSSETVWLRDDVVRPLLDKLDQIRQSRVVWILITDLNKYDLTSRQASELLLMLYQQLPSISWLRFVLDGMQGSIPAALEIHVERFRVSEITVQEIEAHLQRTFNEMQVYLLDDVAIRAGAKGLMRQYEDARTRDAVTARAVLQRAVVLHVSDYL